MSPPPWVESSNWRCRIRATASKSSSSLVSTDHIAATRSWSFRVRMGRVVWPAPSVSRTDCSVVMVHAPPPVRFSAMEYL